MREEPESWFKGEPTFVIELVTRKRSLQHRQQYVRTYLAHRASGVVEVMIENEILLVYHPENVNPLVVRSRIDWPFIATLDQIFEEVRARRERINAG
jgi:hypothetical protein